MHVRSKKRKKKTVSNDVLGNGDMEVGILVDLIGQKVPWMEKETMTDGLIPYGTCVPGGR